VKRIRIFIADDHAVVRRGLALVLRQEADFEIAGEAADGEEALRRIRELMPDLALLDWKMPRLDGLQTARAIKQSLPAVRVLVLSGAQIDATALDALDDAVDGFVHKDIEPAGLAHAIREVASGRPFLGPEIIAALLQRGRSDRRRPSPRPQLSPRERQVLALMATAATYREIGAQLFIEETTVRTYVKRLLAKLNQPNRTQAVIAALRLGLIE
jgi:DNA-binding NarL/FixJ family response regulator